jgi:hypothetical protein
MKLKVDSTKKRLLLSCTALLVGIAVFHPSGRTVKAQGNNSQLQNLHKLEVDCVVSLPAAEGYTSSGVCTGDMGLQHITDSASPGTSLGVDEMGAQYALAGSTGTLTAGDGSTLTYRSAGISGIGSGFSIRNSGIQWTGGTQQFAGAAGAATLTVSQTPATSTRFLVHIDGNIQTIH